MYLPKHFEVTDKVKLHDFINTNGFGILFSHTGPERMASHIPFILDESAGEQAMLLGHMARENPQWEQANGQQVLVVFSGPHVYVSPSWYQEPETVPTWNYLAVHIYGLFRPAEDSQHSQRILQRLTDYFESSQPEPWQADFNTEYTKHMLDRIVAFEIDIQRIQGKWKLNQNQPERRRRRVADTLKNQAGDDSRSIARLIEESMT